MYKIVVMIPLYKRPEIFIRCAQSIKKLTLYAPKVFKVKCMVILSPEDRFYKRNAEIALKYGFKLSVYKNLPLGEKHNAGINAIMQNFDFDYLMNMGSDDLVNPELLNFYLPYLAANNPFFGINNLYMYELKSKKCLFFHTYNNIKSIGAGRMIHKSVLERLQQLNKPLYVNEYDAGMDSCSSNCIVNNLDIEETVIDAGKIPFILDLKTATNINHFTRIELHKDKIQYCEFGSIKKHFGYAARNL